MYTIIFFRFSVYVTDGYGNSLFDSYCGPVEGVFLTSTLNLSVQVRAMNQYDTFTARYAILNGSIDNGKELKISAPDAIMSLLNVNVRTFLVI